MKQVEQMPWNSEQTAVGGGASVVAMLPRVWAVGERAAVGRKRPCSVGAGGKSSATSVITAPQHPKPLAVVHRGERNETQPLQGTKSTEAEGTHATKLFVVQQPKVDMAPYRTYTEAVVRRYGLLSLEAGRVPSLIGRELFRGKVSSYKVQSFEDVVIFCHDVEKCLNRLDAGDQKMIKRVTLQQYTLTEASLMLGISLRSCVRQYLRAVDRLTRLLLGARLMEPLKCCQEGKSAPCDVSTSKGAS